MLLGLAALVGLAVMAHAAEEAPEPPIPVTFEIAKPGYVTLVIEDAEGNRVRNLIAGEKYDAGKHTVHWDGMDESLGVRPDTDGVYRPTGRTVAPGTYRVRGLVRDELTLRYEFSVNSPGSPPWICERRVTDEDGRGRTERFGGWGSEHGAPTSMAFIPGKTSPTGQDAMMIGFYGAERADTLIWTDLDARKLKGLKSIGQPYGDAHCLARDCGPDAQAQMYEFNIRFGSGDADRDPDAQTQIYAYSALGGHVRSDHTLAMIRIFGFTEHGYAQVLTYTERKSEDDLKRVNHRGRVIGGRAELGGLAVYNGLVVVSHTNADKLIFVRAVDPAKKLTVSWSNQHWFTAADPSRDCGALVGKAALDDPRGLAFDKQGRLLALQGAKLLRYTLDPQAPHNLKQPEVLIANGLVDPQSLTLTEAGHILIGDHGTSHQVKVYDATGQAVRVIGKPGGPRVGPYDPMRMQFPKGLAVDARGQLWVAESSWLPKRVSVWTLDGKLVKDVIGAPKYGGSGEIDPKDRTRYYYASRDPREASGTMEFKLDWKAGTDTLAHVIWRINDYVKKHAGDFLGADGLFDARALFYEAGPQTPIHHANGQQYMTNVFTAEGTRQPRGAVHLWRMKDGVAVPVAAIGDAYQSELLMRYPEFRPRFPADIDTDFLDQLRDEMSARIQQRLYTRGVDGVDAVDEKAGKVSPQRVRQMIRENPLMFVWSDRNANQKIEPEEIDIVRLPSGAMLPGGLFINRDLSVQITGGVRLNVARFGAEGAPIYDTANIQRLFDPGELNSSTMASFTDAAGRAVLVCNPIRGYQDGRLRWTYPNEWNSLHGGHSAPAQQYPGQLAAATKVIGYPMTVPGLNTQVWPYNTDRGTIFLFTTDCMFVGQLFHAGQEAPQWFTWPHHERGMSVTHLSIGGESFFNKVTQLDDGQVYATVAGGSSSSIVRVDGLDSIRPIAPSQLVINAADLARINQYRLEREQARQQGQDDAQALTVLLRDRAPTLTGDLSQWEGASWVDIEKQRTRNEPETRAALMISGDRLFVAYLTKNRRNLANNAATDDGLLFKTGGGLDLMFGADARAKADRRDPVAGDRRLLVAQGPDGVVACLYEQVAPDNKENAATFSSPWRDVAFDRVVDVSQDVTLMHNRGSEEVTRGRNTVTEPYELYELSVPLSLLGLKPEPGATYRGDVGVLVGSDGVTTARIYWNNKATGLVNDIPGEAMLTPALWGEWKLSAEGTSP